LYREEILRFLIVIEGECQKKRDDGGEASSLHARFHDPTFFIQTHCHGLDIEDAKAKLLWIVGQGGQGDRTLLGFIGASNCRNRSLPSIDYRHNIITVQMLARNYLLRK